MPESDAFAGVVACAEDEVDAVEVCLGFFDLVKTHGDKADGACDCRTYVVAENAFGEFLLFDLVGDVAQFVVADLMADDASQLVGALDGVKECGGDKNLCAHGEGIYILALNNVDVVIQLTRLDPGTEELVEEALEEFEFGMAAENGVCGADLLLGGLAVLFFSAGWNFVGGGVDEALFPAAHGGDDLVAGGCALGLEAVEVVGLGIAGGLCSGNLGGILVAGLGEGEVVTGRQEEGA